MKTLPRFNRLLACTWCSFFIFASFKACSSWDGRSFLPSIESETDTGREFLVLSQCAHVCQRSVRFGDYLYMHSYHDGYHLFPDDMLFNVAQDPHEQVNLADSLPHIRDQLLIILHSWQEEGDARFPEPNPDYETK